jgi:hypothetical protein
MPDNRGGAYRVIYPPKHFDQLKQWVAASDRATAAALLSALRVIDQHLATEPLGWGEAQYRLRHMGLSTYLRLHAMFRVFYAVDEQRRIVYVMGLDRLADR